MVTSAGLVFAFTMMSMITSDLRSVGQIGTTIGCGLLLDTFIIRALVTPSIATLLGRWFWWPMKPVGPPGQASPSAETRQPQPLASLTPPPAGGREPEDPTVPVPAPAASPEPDALVTETD